jgi:hypothetical protein
MRGYNQGAKRTQDRGEKKMETSSQLGKVLGPRFRAKRIQLIRFFPVLLGSLLHAPRL